MTPLNTEILNPLSSRTDEELVDILEWTAVPGRILAIPLACQHVLNGVILPETSRWEPWEFLVIRCNSLTNTITTGAVVTCNPQEAVLYSPLNCYLLREQSVIGYRPSDQPDVLPAPGYVLVDPDPLMRQVTHDSGVIESRVALMGGESADRRRAATEKAKLTEYIHMLRQRGYSSWERSIKLREHALGLTASARHDIRALLDDDRRADWRVIPQVDYKKEPKSGRLLGMPVVTRVDYAWATPGVTRVYWDDCNHYRMSNTGRTLAFIPEAQLCGYED